MKKLKLFITLEGGEGTGKSTVSSLLKDKFELNGYSAYTTREPGGRGLAIAEDIRKIIMNYGEMHPYTELLLFNASRSEHVDKIIRPNLEKGSIVISDRFSDSTLVYQGLVKKIEEKVILEANEIGMQDTLPDFVFIFDLDPIIGRERILLNNRDTNRFDEEGITFHQKIREAYLKLHTKNPKKYILVDASKKPEEIRDFIYNKIIEYESKIN